MIIDRYLLREITLTLVGVTVLLLLMFLSGTFVRILGDAAQGRYPADIVFHLFALKSLVNSVYLLPLSLFLAVLLALGRLYKDSEMTALVACGMRPGRVLRIAFVLSLLCAVIVAALSLYLVPWAEEQSQELLDNAAATSELDGLVAGHFNQAEGDNLIYVEGISPDRRSMENVFVQSREKGKLVILTARSGHKITDKADGERYLVLRDGYRYDGTPGMPDYRILKFKSHAVRLQDPTVTPSKRQRGAIPTMKLFHSGSLGDIAEWQWRVSTVISTVVLGLLAVPLAKTNPRQGRFAKLFIGIMLYIVYSNMLAVGRSWVGKGEVPPQVGMWWVHLAALAVVALLAAHYTGALRLPRLRWRR